MLPMCTRLRMRRAIFFVVMQFSVLRIGLFVAMVLILSFLSRCGFRIAVRNGAVKRKWSRLPSHRRLLIQVTPLSTAMPPPGWRASVPIYRPIPGWQRPLSGRRRSPWRQERRRILPLLTHSLLSRFSHSPIDKLLCSISIRNRERTNFLSYRM